MPSDYLNKHVALIRKQIALGEDVELVRAFIQRQMNLGSTGIGKFKAEVASLSPRLFGESASSHAAGICGHCDRLMAALRLLRDAPNRTYEEIEQSCRDALALEENAA